MRLKDCEAERFAKCQLVEEFFAKISARRLNNKNNPKLRIPPPPPMDNDNIITTISGLRFDNSLQYHSAASPVPRLSLSLARITVKYTGEGLSTPTDLITEDRGLSCERVIGHQINLPQHNGHCQLGIRISINICIVHVHQNRRSMYCDRDHCISRMAP